MNQFISTRQDVVELDNVLHEKVANIFSPLSLLKSKEMTTTTAIQEHDTHPAFLTMMSQ